MYDFRITYCPSRGRTYGLNSEVPLMRSMICSPFPSTRSRLLFLREVRVLPLRPLVVFCLSMHFVLWYWFCLFFQTSKILDHTNGHLEINSSNYLVKSGRHPLWQNNTNPLVCILTALRFSRNLASSRKISDDFIKLLSIPPYSSILFGGCHFIPVRPLILSPVSLICLVFFVVVQEQNIHELSTSDFWITFSSKIPSSLCYSKT